MYASLMMIGCPRDDARQYLMDFCRPASDVTRDNVFVLPADDSSTYHASGSVHLLSLWLSFGVKPAARVHERSPSARILSDGIAASEDVFVHIVLMDTERQRIRSFRDYAPVKLIYVDVACTFQ